MAINDVIAIFNIEKSYCNNIQILKQFKIVTVLLSNKHTTKFNTRFCKPSHLILGEENRKINVHNKGKNCKEFLGKNIILLNEKKNLKVKRNYLKYACKMK